MNTGNIKSKPGSSDFKIGSMSVALVIVGLMSTSAHSITKADFDKIDRGFSIFTKETFGGNGRTCSTCHVPEANYNIFPSTIQHMSQKDRKLVFADDVPGLENKELTKKFALFNISGNANTFRADEPQNFGLPDPGHPVFRSSMGIQALELTSTNTSLNFPGSPLLPSKCSAGALAGQLRQLGWSGDAAPGSLLNDDDCHTHHGVLDSNAVGLIRSFADGAIAQHNTRSLARILNQDFRLATGPELDALEAFQNWLGRRPVTVLEDPSIVAGQTEFNIKKLDFKDDRIDKGRDHFAGPAEFARTPAAGALVSVAQTTNAGAGCNACHSNGGAKTVAVGGPNNALQNININTEVEQGSDDIGNAVVGFALPHDEGASDSFGPRPVGGPTFDEVFNIQSIIEAPRKQAWFHNHRVLGDFEKAVAFYTGEDFQLIPEGSNPQTGSVAGPDFFDQFVGNPTAVAGAFTSEEVLRFGNAIHGLGTISFPNGDGIEHLGAFLRSASALYSLRDCARLTLEAKTRISVGASPFLAVKHCQFNLADVRNVLKGSKLKPTPYKDIANQTLPLSIQLELALLKFRKNDQQAALDAVLFKLNQMQKQIAVVVSP